MIIIKNKVCDNPIPREELLKNIVIGKTSYDDTQDIITILSNCFNVNSEAEILLQLLNSLADLENSVKVIDERNGDIYGLLIFSKFNITQGSPIMFINPSLGNDLSSLKQINGYSFILDERLRNTNIDKKMLLYNKEYIDQFDMVWCGVDKSLKSHNYWKRLGFEEVLNIYDAIFYVKYL